MSNWLSLHTFLGIFTLWFPSTSPATSDLSSSDMTDYCQFENFTAQCHDSEILLIQKAQYGRMKMGRCVENNLGFIGCGKDVVAYMHSICSGRHGCKLKLPDQQLDSMSTCISDVKSYLTVKYRCVPVITPSRDACRHTDHVMTGTGQGYLANIVTDTLGCGSYTTPWRIVGQKGQVIELILTDFSVWHARRNCEEYATVREPDGETTKICGGLSRDEWTYTSQTHILDVAIKTQTDRSNKNYFLVHFKVVGCAIPKLSANQRASRDNDVLTVECLTDKKKSILTCHGNTWSGRIANCSTSGISGADEMVSEVSIPTGFTVAIILGVSVLIGSMILLVGVLCMRFCRARRHAAHSTGNGLDKDKCTYGCAPLDIPLAMPGDHTTASTLTSATSIGSDRRHKPVNAAYSAIWDYGANNAPERAALYSTLPVGGQLAPTPSGIYCKKHDVVLNLSDYATARNVCGHARPYTPARDAYLDEEPDCRMHTGSDDLGMSHPQEADTSQGVGGGQLGISRDGYFPLQAAMMSTESDTNTGPHSGDPCGSVDLLTFNPKTETSQT